ncbi:Hvo_1808 family surface protein [Halorussus aquaticus]|uniref:Hvo_1808 family surface protein n=1 Tax=Halorussus aquaticus TaxID=2953748 RepID=A0ABD5Q2D9_9EURY|nr:Hvo_1808 family surface protein [Halorussus aquaticus]
MLTHGNGTTATLLVLLLLASGVAGATVGSSTAKKTSNAATANAPTANSATATAATANAATVNRATEGGATSAQDDGGTQNATVASCAATPPENGSDPASDVKGWENGYWYDESIDVRQDDGVQRGERETIVSRTMARVEAVRCIEFNQSVPVELLSREEYRQQQAGRNVSDGLRAFDNGKFEALFLVNESADSIAVQNRNRGSGVLGFYSPRRDRIVVIAENAETLRMDELTLAHELMHAWQDQQYNLSGEPFAAKFRDQVNARNGIVEGDARYTEQLYAELCGEAWNCLEPPSRRSAGPLANIGVYLLKYQPYSDGPAFVRMVFEVGGWDAVNALYADLPASTEQIIHPQKYNIDEPTNVSLSDEADESWSRVRPPDRPGYGQLGEAALMAMFIYPYYHSQGQSNVVPPAQWFNRNETGNVSDFDPLNYESQFSTGWDGDRLHVYRNESGAGAYVWRLAWDSPQDATQFVEGYSEVLRYWGGEEVAPNVWRIDRGGFADAFYVDVNETTVTIVNAPTVSQLNEVRSSVGPLAGDQPTDDAEATATVETETNETATNGTATNETTTEA